MHPLFCSFLCPFRPITAFNSRYTYNQLLPLIMGLKQARTRTQLIPCSPHPHYVFSILVLLNVLMLALNAGEVPFSALFPLTLTRIQKSGVTDDLTNPQRIVNFGTLALWERYRLCSGFSESLDL